MTKHEKLAYNLFLDGYNCSQAVAMAFCDVTKKDEKEMSLIASPFGGGMGRMRETCGAVSGMLLVLGLLYGYSQSNKHEEKKLLYQRVQELVNKFKEENGSYNCGVLTGIKDKAPNPTERNEEYYKKRPCTELVKSAARILDEFIENNR